MSSTDQVNIFQHYLKDLLNFLYLVRKQWNPLLYLHRWLLITIRLFFRKRTFHSRQMSDTKDPTVADGVNVAHADDTKKEKFPEKVATIREVKDESIFNSFLAT